MDTSQGSFSGGATTGELDTHRLKLIETALEDGRVELVRQAIVPLQREDDGACYGLIPRIRDDRGALLPSDLVVTAVERLGMAERIDRWVLLGALRGLREQEGSGGAVPLCFFKPFSRLADDNFWHFVIQELRESGVNPNRLCLAVDEADVASYMHPGRFVQPLRELGCRTAVVDIDSERSVGAHVHSFAAEFMGIEGRLVERSLHDPSDMQVVRMINEIAHLFGRRTIAKAAYSPDLIDMLRKMKVDYVEASASEFGAEPFQRTRRRSMGDDLAAANVNRAYSLAGTSIAIFTFMLFFLYPRFASGEINALLFQATLVVMGVATFSFVFASFYYYCSSLGNRIDDAERATYSRRGDRFWLVGYTLLFLDPSLILFAIGLLAVGSVWCALWLVYLIFVIRHFPRVQTARKNS